MRAENPGFDQTISQQTHEEGIQRQGKTFPHTRAETAKTMRQVFLREEQRPRIVYTRCYHLC